MVRAGKFYQLANRENTGVWGCLWPQARRRGRPGAGVIVRAVMGRCGGQPEGGVPRAGGNLGGVPFFYYYTC